MRKISLTLLSCLLIVSLFGTLIPLCLSANGTNAAPANAYRSGEDYKMWIGPDGKESAVSDKSKDDLMFTYYPTEDFDNNIYTPDQAYSNAIVKKPRNSDEDSMSMLDYWAQIAEDVLHAHEDDVDHHDGAVAYNCRPWTNLHEHLNNYYGEEENKDEWSTEEDPDWWWPFKFRWCTPAWADDFATIQSRMWDHCVEQINKAPARDHSDWIKNRFRLDELVQNTTSSSPILYTMVNSVAVHDASYLHYIDNYILAFYDFKIKNVLPEQYATNTGLEDIESMEEVENKVAEAGGTYSEPKKDGPGGTEAKDSYEIKDLGSTVLLPETHLDNLSKNTANGPSTTFTRSTTSSMTTTSTTTTSTTNTDSISYNIGAGMSKTPAEMLSAGGVGYSFNFGLSTTGTWSDCYTNSEAVSGTNSTTTQETLSVSLADVPPHCSGEVYASTVGTEKTLKYKGPFCVTFKVAICACCGAAYCGGGVLDTHHYPQNTLTFKFGESDSESDSSDAISDLYNYYNIKNKNINSNTDSSDWINYWVKGNLLEVEGSSIDDGSDKNVVLNYSDDLGKTMANMLGKVPLMDSYVSTTATVSEYKETKPDSRPYYPLNKVCAYTAEDKKNELTEMNMDVGGNYDLSRVPLAGYDRGTSDLDVVEYYGFTKKAGKWVVCDEAGNEISDTSVVEITPPDASGAQRLKSLANGTAHIKYIINEDCYTSVNQGNCTVYTKNTDLTRYPLITLNVKKGSSFTGSVEISGDIVINTGEDFDLSSDKNTLSVIAVDESGKHHDVDKKDLTWTAQESESEGISINNNVITAWKPGIYHIKAMYGEAQSVWYAITAEGDEVQNVRLNPMVDNPCRVESFVIGSDTNQVSNGKVATSIYNTGKTVDSSDSQNQTTQTVSADGSSSLRTVEEHITWLKEHHIIPENADFNKDDYITKEEFVSLLYNLAKLKGRNVSADPCILDCADISEVSPDKYDAVNWAVSRGIIKIDSSNYIKPKTEFTKQQYSEGMKQFILDNPDLYVQGKRSWWKELFMTFLYIFK